MALTRPVHAKTIELKRGLLIGAALIGLGASLGACTHTSDTADITASVPPTDYRLRHPIAIREGDRTTVVFVGNSRGGLTSTQRDDVIAFGQEWMREGTGTIIAEVPTDTPNARAAAESLRDIQGVLAAQGVPPRGVLVKQYRPADPRTFAPIRLIYPRVTAEAGPCGTWPEDLGPSIKSKSYLENRPYYNLGCANQRNLAAMVENPTDLVQPRTETPAYTARRQQIYETYRTTKPDSASSKNVLSNVGQ